ncbi:MAG: hypothetical protein QXY39_03780 [Thermofilaceae archaeon]
MNPEEYIIRFLGDEQREIMIRKNGNILRNLILNSKDFLEYLYMPDIYYGIRTVYDLLMDTWSRIVFDFDAHDGGFNEVRETVKALINYLELNNVKPNVIFTGRGYQVVLIFDDNLRIDIDLLRRELKEINIERLDLAVLNTNPMARMPYTFNTKAGRLSIPVNPYDLETEYDRVEYTDISYIQALFPDSVSREYKINRIEFDFNDFNKIPLCIMRMISYMGITGELDHQSRFSLAVFLLRTFGYETTMRIFNLAGDFNLRMTDYQLRHIMNRRYLFPKCERIMELGWCNRFIKCPFRPWLEIYLKEWRRNGNEG